MCRFMTRICHSDALTVFTNGLRCFVSGSGLMNQRVEWCAYGFYGFFIYTHLIRNKIKYCNGKILYARLRAKGVLKNTVKSVNSVSGIPESVEI